MPRNVSSKNSRTHRPWWLSWLARYIHQRVLQPYSKVEGSNPGVIYFRRLNKSKINAFVQELRMRNCFLAHAHKTSIFGDDVIQPAYDVIGHSHTQVDGRLTCQFDDGERGRLVRPSSTADLVMPNCGKRRTGRNDTGCLPLNHRQWRSTLDDVINSIMGLKRKWTILSLLHLFKSYISVSKH